MPALVAALLLLSPPAQPPLPKTLDGCFRELRALCGKYKLNFTEVGPTKGGMRSLRGKYGFVALEREGPRGATLRYRTRVSQQHTFPDGFFDKRFVFQQRVPLADLDPQGMRWSKTPVHHRAVVGGKGSKIEGRATHAELLVLTRGGARRVEHSYEDAVDFFRPKEGSVQDWSKSGSFKTQKENVLLLSFATPVDARRGAAVLRQAIRLAKR